MAVCKRCNKKALVTDSLTGNTVCSSCGVVQDFTNFQEQFGDGGGNYITHGTTGAGHDYSYKERKLYQSKLLIEEITFRLTFTDARTRDVKEMVNKVTDGEFGLGDWFSVLVGACCYIVMRQINRVMTINEVCDAVGCDLYEMGRMVGRVVDFLGLELPEFDVVALLERTIRGFSGFNEIDGEKLEEMVKQGNFVVQCCIKWWLTTGRRPGPVAVAVLVFVAGVNGIKLRIDEVAKEVNVGIATCRLRHKELLEALVEVAKGLPWGNDINVKNVMRHAPCVMKYMEMKSMEEKGSFKMGCGDDLGNSDDAQMVNHKKRRLDHENGVFDSGNGFGDLFGSDVGSNIDVGGGIENESQFDGEERDKNGNCDSGIDTLKDLKVKTEAVANLYSKFKADFASHKTSNREVGHQYADGLDDPDLQFFDEWWSGKSELCEKLFLKQLEEKDVGLNTLPPSYIRGCLAVKKRREKITAAKIRINSIRFPSADKKRKSGSAKTEQHHISIDWEDFIIETLLLHKVKEEEIEKGHYKALLGLHVFNGSE